MNIMKGEKMVTEKRSLTVFEIRGLYKEIKNQNKKIKLRR
jgi:hypothetical protein